VFLKNDCIYHHKFIQFHFTTYDVRCGTDIVNPGTSHCNIMLLADDGEGTLSLDCWLSGRLPASMLCEFLLLETCYTDYPLEYTIVVNPGSSGWSNSKLDSVCFPPMNKNCSFSFVDPKDVLRGCHILPAFAKGKRQVDGIGISCCAKDSKDYNQYYINRCVYCLLATSDFILFP
ncbi:hypothetical protein L208DRAFT_1320062, partial [Tricholoma matsutake]